MSILDTFRRRLQMHEEKVILYRAIVAELAPDEEAHYARQRTRKVAQALKRVNGSAHNGQAMRARIPRANVKPPKAGTLAESILNLLHAAGKPLDVIEITEGVNATREKPISRAHAGVELATMTRKGRVRRVGRNKKRHGRPQMYAPR